MITLELPWPPSVNSYWRRNGNRYFISQKGVTFRRNVYILTSCYRKRFSKSDRLSVSIDAYPPDKRQRDLDNLLKSIQDSLEHAEVYHDDNQIDELCVKRFDKLLSKIVVRIAIVS